MAIVKRIASSIIGTALRVILIVFVVMTVYKTSLQAYDFGFRVFAEKPVSVGSGRDVEVTVPEGSGAMAIGDILKEHGLIRDSKLFYCQEMLSAYHGKLQPGVYTLNTSQNATEMMAVMAGNSSAEEEDS